MKLDLNEIAHNVGKRQKYTVDEPCWEDEEAGVRCVGSVSGNIEFSNTGRLMIARGRLSARLELECGRCLTKFETPVETNIEEEFELPNYQAADERIEEEEPEAPSETEPLFVDNIFDLSEFIRQSLVLSVPIQPLCDTMCKGLCEQCGQNLNLEACECPRETESPFAALASLLEAEEPETGEGGTD